MIVLGIGFYFSRKKSNSESFYLGNRTLGAWVTAFSASASGESGWVFLGAVGMAYNEGFVAIWFAIGITLGCLLNWIFIAPKIQKESKELGSITMTDIFVDRTREWGDVIRYVATIIIFFSMISYVAAQLTAAGKAFNAGFGWSYPFSVLVAGSVVIFYTLLGGFPAVSWTDLVQGLLMVFSLILIPLVALFQFLKNGYGWSDLMGVSSGYTSFFGNRSGFFAFGGVLGLLGIGIGFPGQPHILTRFMACRSPRDLLQGKIIALVFYLLTFSGVVLLGVTCRLLLNVSDPETVFSKAATTFLPLSLAGLMLSAVMSAIMSTADSQLLVATSSICHDIFEHFGHLRQISMRRLNRIAVLFLGIAAIIFALSKVRVIFWFVLFAWSGMGTSFGPAMIYVLYAKKPRGLPVVLGMVSGFLMTVSWKVTGLSGYLYEMIPGFLFSSLVVFLTDQVVCKEQSTCQQSLARLSSDSQAVCPEDE